MEPLGTTGAGVWCSSVRRALHTCGKCKPIHSSVPLRSTSGLHFPSVFVSPLSPHHYAHCPSSPLRSACGHCTPSVSAHRQSQLIPQTCLVRSAPLRCFFGAPFRALRSVTSLRSALRALRHLLHARGRSVRSAPLHSLRSLGSAPPAPVVPSGSLLPSLRPWLAPSTVSTVSGSI